MVIFSFLKITNYTINLNFQLSDKFQYVSIIQILLVFRISLSIGDDAY